jgi:hypothetical protein
MSLKKKVKCLVCRLLVSLGLKSVSSCKAGPLPVNVEAPKKTTKKSTRKTKTTKSE